jgi:hypothetical protein
MDEQLVAFIDLLGFRSIITAKDDTRQEQILALLTDLTNAKSEARSERIRIDASSERLEVDPAISAFSDNLVVSFTAAALAEVGSGPIIYQLANNIATIFRSAIRMGCLVRGGIAFGRLHHAKGVLFGPGLVEAYELESKLAARPRVLLSPRAAERVGDHPILRSDQDGFLCIDYVRAAYDQVGYGLIGRTERQMKFKSWATEIKELCEDQIRELSEKGNLAALQNWRWFLNWFERFMREQAIA